MAELPKVTGTIVRGTTYYTHLRIPAVLRDAYPNKTHRVRSLRTSDPKVAARGVTVARADLIREADAARRNTNVAELVATLRPDQKALLDEAGGLDGLLDAYRRTMTARAFMQAGDPAHDSYPDDDEEPDRPALESRMAEAEHRGALAALDQQAKAEGKTLIALGHGVAVPGEVTGLAELADAYCNEKGSPGQTREAIQYVVRRFRELHGDLALSDLTVGHLREYADMARGLPKQWNAKAVRGLPIRDAVRLTKTKGLPTIGEETRGNHVTFLKMLTAFAVPMGYMKSDPWAPYKKIERRGKNSAKEKPRYPFSPADASRILTAASGFHPATIDRWAPLLACYQGARLEEIAQLRACDVIEVDGFPCIRITDAGDGQKTKNIPSVRTLPLHPKVIAGGFIDFISGRNDKSFLFMEQERWGGKLNPVRPRGARGRLAGPFGKRFSRMLREKLGITDPKRTFHSFRHLWETKADRAAMRESDRRALAGRSANGDSQADYEDTPPMASLYESLSLIDPLAGATVT